MSKRPASAQPVALHTKGSIRVRKAPELVADVIRDKIVRGELKEGDLLPAESALMEEFGVSRPTIREAYRILEAERLVSVARGAKGGAVVHEPDPELIANYTLMVFRASRTTISEIYQARMAFEPPAARLCAEQNSKQAAAALREILEHEFEIIDDIPAFAASLTQFHRAIVELSGNRPMIHLAAAVHQVVERHQANIIALRSLDQPTNLLHDTIKVGLKSHARLIQFIEQEDGDQAESHWRLHMLNAHKSWVTGYENTLIGDLFPPVA